MQMCFVESPSDEVENNEETEETRRYSDSTDHELVDMFSEYYQPYALTVLETLYPHLMQKSCRYVMTILFLFTISSKWVVRIKTSSNEILRTAVNPRKKSLETKINLRIIFRKLRPATEKGKILSYDPSRTLRVRDGPKERLRRRLRAAAPLFPWKPDEKGPARGPCASKR